MNHEGARILFKKAKRPKGYIGRRRNRCQCQNSLSLRRNTEANFDAPARRYVHWTLRSHLFSLSNSGNRDASESSLRRLTNGRVGIYSFGGVRALTGKQ